MAIAPQPPGVGSVTGNGMVFTIAEDSNAAANYSYDILTAYTGAGGSVDSAFYTALSAAFANQAAARTVLNTQFRMTTTRLTGALGGGTDFAQLILDPNVSAPATTKNFRFDIASTKTANGTTGSWIITLEYRHSVIR